MMVKKTWKQELKKVPADAMVLPSGDTARAVTGPLCFEKILTQFPFCISHIRQVWSLEPVTR